MSIGSGITGRNKQQPPRSSSDMHGIDCITRNKVLWLRRALGGSCGRLFNGTHIMFCDVVH